MTLDQRKQSPKHLAECMRDGTLGLPDFQRPSVWAAKQQKELLDSLIRGLSIGVITLWTPPSGLSVERQRPFFPNERGRRHDHLVLDGQQRLRALCALCSGPDPYQRKPKSIFVSKSGDLRVGKTARHGDVSTSEIAQKPVADIRTASAEQRKMIRRVKDALTSDAVTVVVVPLRENGDAIDLFERINSRGQRLAVKDLVAARLSEVYPEYITECDQLSTRLTGDEGKPRLSCFDRMVLTKVVAFGATGRKTSRAKDAHAIVFNALHGATQRASGRPIPVKSLLEQTGRAGKRLRDELLSRFGLSSSLTETALDGSAATVALQYLVTNSKPTQSELTMLRRWLFVMLFSTYYTGGATESKVDADMKAMSERSVDWQQLFQRASEGFSGRGVVLRATPNSLELETSPSFWRKQANRKYLEVLRLFSIANQSLYGWCDSAKKVRLGDSDATLQHIFPRKPKKTRRFKQGVNLKEHPANYATIERTENSTINNKEPHEYLATVDIRARRQQHVPKEGLWKPNMQGKFLDARTQLILRAAVNRYRRSTWA